MKKCTQCLIEKEFIYFPKRKTNKDGLYSWCKDCSKKKTKIYAALNPEKVRQSKEKRKEKAYETAKKYKEKNKKRLDKLKKLYYIEHRNEILEKAKKYSRLNEPWKTDKKKKYLKEWKNSESGKLYLKERQKYHKKRYEIISKAGQKLQDAIRSGKIIRPDKCSLCSNSGKIEGHHNDYSKPLEVVWLCKQCHMMLHKSLKERNKLKENENGSQRDCQEAVEES